MTTETKLTAKQKLINNVLGMSNNTYSTKDLEAMKVAEIKELLADMKKELLTPDVEVGKDGKFIAPVLTEEQKAAIAKVEAAPAKDPKAPKAPKADKGPSKRETLYAIFDKAHAEGVKLKDAAKAALPETSDGVIASYATYWRSDRGIVAERKFGNTAPKATKAEKALAALRKIYGEEFEADANAVFVEVMAVWTTQKVAADEEQATGQTEQAAE